MAARALLVDLARSGRRGRSVGSERRSVGGTSRSVSGLSSPNWRNTLSVLIVSATRNTKPSTVGTPSGERSASSSRKSGWKRAGDGVLAERLGEQQRRVGRVLLVADADHRRSRRCWSTASPRCPPERGTTALGPRRRRIGKRPALPPVRAGPGSIAPSCSWASESRSGSRRIAVAVEHGAGAAEAQRALDGAAAAPRAAALELHDELARGGRCWREAEQSSSGRLSAACRRALKRRLGRAEPQLELQRRPRRGRSRTPRRSAARSPKRANSIGAEPASSIVPSPRRWPRTVAVIGLVSPVQRQLAAGARGLAADRERLRQAEGRRAGSGRSRSRGRAAPGRGGPRRSAATPGSPPCGRSHAVAADPEGAGDLPRAPDGVDHADRSRTARAPGSRRTSPLPRPPPRRRSADGAGAASSAGASVRQRGRRRLVAAAHQEHGHGAADHEHRQREHGEDGAAHAAAVYVPPSGCRAPGWPPSSTTAPCRAPGRSRRRRRRDCRQHST